VRLLSDRSGLHRQPVHDQPENRRCNDIRVAGSGGSGLEALLKYDAELAFVLAHELAHVILEHTGQGKEAIRHRPPASGSKSKPTAWPCC